MDEQMQQLVALQKLDTRILSIRRKIDAAPVVAASENASFKEAQKKYDAVIASQQSIEKKKRDKESQIQELNEKIAKMRARSADIKTNKEFQANTKEIESFEKQIRTIEDEMLVIMESIDATAKAAAAESAAFSAAKVEAEASGSSRSCEIKVAEDEMKELKSKRKDYIAKIDPDLYEAYVRLMKDCRGLAVVEVIKEVCQGCHMNIPPQMFVQIKLGKDMFNCPQCRRIMYYIAPEKPAEAPADKTAAPAAG